MIKNLVSIITPCYNGEKYVSRLLESVLAQDYPMIEMYVVDDGSTDNSYALINSYIPKFKNKGYSLQCIRQKNSGQAAAIQKALKQVQGEFLTWPDNDDFFSSNKSISKFVERFTALPQDYGIVRCYVNYVDGDSLKFLYLRKFNINKEKQFEEFFLSKESIAVAGLYMVRMSAFDKANPQREIYIGEHPQNWQLLLPVLYNSKISTIELPLYTVLVRNDSHSRAKKTYEQSLKTLDGYLNILTYTINQIQMPNSDKTKYLLKIKRHIFLARIDNALFNFKKEEILSVYKDYRAIGGTITFGKKVKICSLLIHPICLKMLNKVLSIKQ